MNLKIYQVDAFTNKLFGGNPAAVVPLESWLPDNLLQSIAAENNLAETAFYIKNESRFHIRWFTPKAEVDLCGHATLATAYVLFNVYGYDGEVSFDSRSGILSVAKEGDWLTLDFPADNLERIEPTEKLIRSFDKAPKEIYKGVMDYLFVYNDQKEIEQVKPDLIQIAKFGTRGIIITAKGNEADFVSRYFAPGVGISEDPVTGSAHTTLMPYWTKVSGKNELTARQLSERGGFLKCKLEGERVKISGEAVLYLTGEINV